MSLLCSALGHVPMTTRHHNQGMEFAICHRCACDLVRAEDESDWATVPKGFRVVWRGVSRDAVAGAIALPAPARRRDPRNARPAPRRDPRGRPLAGAVTMIGMFASLGRLDGSEDQPEPAALPAPERAIRLPGA